MMISKEIKAKIKGHALQNLNEEVCGFIENGEVYPCRNLSQKPKYHFFINPILLIEKDVSCIYHSHVIGTCKPSKTDIIFQKQIDIPFLIYGLIDDSFYFLNN